jgi:hypothetical protein
MKYFYACPDIPVDHDEVRRDRVRYWDCEQHIYKEERLVCLDTRKPGDKTVPIEKLEVVKDRFQEWAVFPGQLKVNAPSMIEDESLAATRKVRIQEEKQMKESIQRQKNLEQLIEAATKKGKKDSTTAVTEKKVIKKVNQQATVEAVSTSSKGSRTTKATAPIFDSNFFVTVKQFNQILAELADLKRQNEVLRSNVQNQQSSAAVSKVTKQISDEDSALLLAQKKRKVAEEEFETTQKLAQKNLVQAEADEKVKQIRREGELQRVKLKVQADEIQDESARRIQARDEEERRRRNKFEDQQRRQDMEFAEQDHAVSIEEKKANIRLKASNQQHEQQLQLIYASQQPNNLAIVIGNKSHQANSTPAAAVENTTVGRTFSTSSKVVQKAEEVQDENAILLKRLMEEIQKEKNLQSELLAAREGADEGDYEEEQEEDA